MKARPRLNLLGNVAKYECSGAPGPNELIKNIQYWLTLTRYCQCKVLTFYFF